jgi:hypothetical protein
MRRALLLAAVAVAAACGVPEEDQAVVARDEDVPFDLLAPSTTTTSTTSTTSTTLPEVPLDRIIDICLVQGDGIVPVERTLARRRTLAEVVEALRRGPTPDEIAGGYATALPGPEAVGPVALAGGTATVALGGSFAEAPAPAQLQAIAQLVCTLTGQPGIGRVQFTLDGQPVQAPLPDGSLAGGSVSRDDYASLLRPAAERATPQEPPAERTEGA